MFVLLTCVSEMSAIEELEHMRKISQEVLDKLYKVTSNKRFNFTPPTVVVKDEKNAVAAFYPLKNEVVLEKAAYEICRGFDKDSLSALAFILGHELTHSFQMEIMKNKQQTSYMAYHNHYEGSHKLEKGADISGAFNAYLAGYKTEGIVGSLISQLYEVYQLDNQITNYPSKQERMHTAEEVAGIVKDLIQIFEMAAYLSSIGEYKFAAASYEKVLEYYEGREIYNNLGVCYALQAMTFSDKDKDLYLFPFEFDQNSRIKKPKTDVGGKDVDEREKRMRIKYLNRALKYLNEALSLDQTYFAADINIVCVKTLLEDYVGAIGHYETKGMKLRGEMEMSKIYEQRSKMALAIAYAKSENLNADKLFATLSKSDYPVVAYMAKYNERIYLEGECGAAEDYSCVVPFDSDEVVDEIYLDKNVVKGKKILLHEEDDLSVNIQKKRNSMVFRFQENDELKFSMQKITKRSSFDISKELTEDKKILTLNTNKGALMVCEEEKSIFYVKERAKEVVEWVKYEYNN